MRSPRVLHFTALHLGLLVERSSAVISRVTCPALGSFQCCRVVRFLLPSAYSPLDKRLICSNVVQAEMKRFSPIPFLLHFFFPRFSITRGSQTFTRGLHNFLAFVLCLEGSLPNGLDFFAPPPPPPPPPAESLWPGPGPPPPPGPPAPRSLRTFST